MASKTLANMVTINDRNLADILAMQTREIPEVINILPAVESSHGTNHTWPVVTALPATQARTIGTGLTPNTDTTTTSTVALKIMSNNIMEDARAAESYVKGLDAFLERQLALHVQALLYDIELQVFQGTVGGLAGGFSGLADALNSLGATVVVPASPGAASSNTSVYAIKAMEDDFAVVVNGELVDMTVEFDKQMVESADDLIYPAYVADIENWFGIQLGHTYAAARLANVNAAALTSATALTDADISKLVEALDEDPTHLIMNREARTMLRNSRTTYSPTGAPAPFPTEWNGIPILTTRGIGIAEATLT